MTSPDSNSPRDYPQSPTQRRSSFVDMFNPRPSMSSQNQSGRRLSITTLGLSTLPQAQSAPFSALRTRAESVSSANSTTVDESPFEDDSGSPASLSNSVPATPFARRMSFGAQRSIRGSAGGATNAAVAVGNANEGYDFAEKLRARAERSSISNGYGGQINLTPTSQPHQRSKSIAAMEPPKAVQAIKQQQQRPDAFQERILKGDFYMD